MMVMVGHYFRGNADYQQQSPRYPLLTILLNTIQTLSIFFRLVSNKEKHVLPPQETYRKHIM